MKLKKHIHLFTTLVILLFYVACNLKLESKPIHELSGSELSNLEWMVSVSKIEVPKESIRLDYYPYIEYGKLFKFKLPMSKVDTFIVNNQLKPIRSLRVKIILISEVEKSWYKRNLDNIAVNEYYYLTDCKSGNVWNILVKKSSGELWYEMLYPDYGGDEPECDKESQF